MSCFLLQILSSYFFLLPETDIKWIFQGTDMFEIKFPDSDAFKMPQPKQYVYHD